MLENTLLLIKPNAQDKIGSILKMVEDNEFAIIQMRKFKMDIDLANEFYKIHFGKPFFPELVKFMTSGDIVAVQLQKDCGVSKLRELIGATNYVDARVGTIRYLFADSLTENAVHGSDSVENAKKEIEIIFG